MYLIAQKYGWNGQQFFVYSADKGNTAQAISLNGTGDPFEGCRANIEVFQVGMKPSRPPSFVQKCANKAYLVSPSIEDGVLQLNTPIEIDMRVAQFDSDLADKSADRSHSGLSRFLVSRSNYTYLLASNASSHAGPGMDLWVARFD